ncbi:MAG: phosphoethanolamine transferase [Muribaculaceae bacterium]|nr:phosphoethanolamine transferase [Muribaculaceae bacterium]
MNIASGFNRLCGGMTRQALHLWVAMLATAFASLCDVIEFASRQPQAAFAIAGLICYAVCKASAVTLLYIFCRNNRWLRWGCIVFIAGFVVLSVVNLACLGFYGFGITRKLITILCETNPGEVREFIPNLLSQAFAAVTNRNLWCAVLIFIILWRGVPEIPARIFIPAAGVISLLGGGYFVYVYATAEFGKSNHIIYVRTARCIRATIQDMRNIRELSRQRRPLPDGITASSEYKADRVVVVIGESASRDHLSLYGYPLPTSPNLDSISAGLYVFSDAIGASSSTAENIPRLLTFMTDEPSQREWYEYPTLIQLFKALGYSTSWLSNQERTGELSNLSGILSNDADVVKYLGSQNSEDHYLYKYDEVLLPAWTELMEKGKRRQLAFLHLMGSHIQYHNRFPADRSKFTADDVLGAAPRKWLTRKKAAVIANYDNSLLYTDSILNRIISELRRSELPSVMVYLSDHGENVFDNRDFNGRDPEFVRVPFIIYANEAYRRLNPEIIADIERSLHQPFSTSELPQLLLHLSGSGYKSYSPQRDPLSPQFRPRTRYVDDEPFKSSRQ